MKRVRFLEEKRGISYAKVGGKLFRGVTVVASIAWIYTFLMNLMFILSMSLAFSIGQADFSYVGNAFVTICVGCLLMVLGAVLVVWSKKTGKNAALILGIVFAVVGLLGILEKTGILTGVPIFQFGIPAVLSIYFDLFSGFVQAYVFSLLTMVYIAGSLPGPKQTEA